MLGRSMDGIVMDRASGMRDADVEKKGPKHVI